MNREILFKAKRIDNGEWVEGYYVKTRLGTDIKPSDVIFVPFKINRNEEWGWIKIDPETLCQCTGLTDKNGKKIWENDILKFNDEIWYSCYTSCGTEYDSWEAENYGVVGYCDYSARYDFAKYKYNENQVEADLHENHDIEFSEFVKEHEVIGNIFDNPELLEVE